MGSGHGSEKQLRNAPQSSKRITLRPTTTISRHQHNTEAAPETTVLWSKNPNHVRKDPILPLPPALGGLERGYPITVRLRPTGKISLPTAWSLDPSRPPAGPRVVTILYTSSGAQFLAGDSQELHFPERTGKSPEVVVEGGNTPLLAPGRRELQAPVSLARRKRQAPL